jgi:hypothetical protein
LRTLLDELLDITLEVDMLNEIKDIHDELYMISRVLDQQNRVINKMSSFLQDRAPPDSDDDFDISPQMLHRWEKIIASIDQRQIKLADMDSNAHRTFKNINNLFDMKQRQANVLEAHYSRRVSQDSGRQATTVMIFTVVTIIFLPLSFMSSFFTLPIAEFPRDRENQNSVAMPLHYAAGRIFGIGFGIAIFIVVIGFGFNEVNARWAKAKPVIAMPNTEKMASSIKTAASQISGANSVPSFTTGISNLSLLRRRETPLRSPDGGRFLFQKKRVQYATARGDAISSFTYESIIRPEKDDKEELSTPTSARSWWSFPLRSSPLLGSAGAVSTLERGSGARRHAGSWGITQSSGWTLFKRKGNDGRVSTV